MGDAGSRVTGHPAGGRHAVGPKVAALVAAWSRAGDGRLWRTAEPTRATACGGDEIAARFEELADSVGGEGWSPTAEALRHAEIVRLAGGATPVTG